MGAVLPFPAEDDTVPAFLRTGELVELALLYAALGWRVLPVHPPTNIHGELRCGCGTRGCNAAGKHPCLKEWNRRATSEPSQIADLWEKWNDANIGILTGRVSGIVVLDVDPRNGGADSLSLLLQKHGALPRTVTAASGGGGTHYYFRYPEAHIGKVSNAFGEDYPGIDILGDGGLVIAPPSLHASGQHYSWTEGSSPTDVEPAELPTWVLKRLPKRSKKRHRNGHKTGRSTTVPPRFREGRRNNTLISLSGAVSGFCRSLADLDDLLQHFNQTRCDPPLPSREVSDIAASGFGYGNSSPQSLSNLIWSAETCLSAHEKAVLWVLINHCDWKSWRCFPSIATIAKASGFSERTIVRAVKDLECRGLISRQRRRFKSTLYTVHVDLVTQTLSPAVEANDAVRSGGPSCLDSESRRLTRRIDAPPPDT